MMENVSIDDQLDVTPQSTKQISGLEANNDSNGFSLADWTDMDANIVTSISHDRYTGGGTTGMSWIVDFT